MISYFFDYIFTETEDDITFTINTDFKVIGETENPSK